MRPVCGYFHASLRCMRGLCLNYSICTYILCNVWCRTVRMRGGSGRFWAFAKGGNALSTHTPSHQSHLVVVVDVSTQRENDDAKTQRLITCTGISEHTQPHSHVRTHAFEDTTIHRLASTTTACGVNSDGSAGLCCLCILPASRRRNSTFTRCGENGTRTTTTTTTRGIN